MMVKYLNEASALLNTTKYINLTFSVVGEAEVKKEKTR